MMSKPGLVAIIVRHGHDRQRGLIVCGIELIDNGLKNEWGNPRKVIDGGIEGRTLTDVYKKANDIIRAYKKKAGLSSNTPIKRVYLPYHDGREEREWS